MASVNKAIIVGTNGKDPEIKQLSDGRSVANLTLATNEKWKDKQTGELKEKTEWHRVVLFGRLAELAGQYIKKGDSTYIEGKIETKKYTGQDGVERYSTQINGLSMQFLGGRKQAEQQPAASAPQEKQAEPDFDDDIPF